MAANNANIGAVLAGAQAVAQANLAALLAPFSVEEILSIAIENAAVVVAPAAAPVQPVVVAPPIIPYEQRYAAWRQGLDQITARLAPVRAQFDAAYDAYSAAPTAARQVAVATAKLGVDVFQDEINNHKLIMPERDARVAEPVVDVRNQQLFNSLAKDNERPHLHEGDFPVSTVLLNEIESFFRVKGVLPALNVPAFCATYAADASSSVHNEVNVLISSLGRQPSWQELRVHLLRRCASYVDQLSFYNGIQALSGKLPNKSFKNDHVTFRDRLSASRVDFNSRVAQAFFLCLLPPAVIRAVHHVLMTLPENVNARQTSFLPVANLDRLLELCEHNGDVIAAYGSAWKVAAPFRPCKHCGEMHKDSDCSKHKRKLAADKAAAEKAAAKKAAAAAKTKAAKGDDSSEDDDSEKTASVAAQSSSSRRDANSGMVCFKCGQVGHGSADCNVAEDALTKAMKTKGRQAYERYKAQKSK